MVELAETVDLVADFLLLFSVALNIVAFTDFYRRVRSLHREVVISRIYARARSWTPPWHLISAGMVLIMVSFLLHALTSLFAQALLEELWHDALREALGAIGFIFTGLGLLKLDLALREKKSPLISPRSGGNSLRDR